MTQAQRYTTVTMQLQIGVKIIIRNNKDKLLVIKRTELLQNESVTSWDIPGGRIEPNEDLRTALAREMLEELGVAINETPHLVNAQDIFVPAKDLHVVRLTYLAHEDISSESITLSDEHQQLAWLTLDEARNQVNEPFLKETLMLLS